MPRIPPPRTRRSKQEVDREFSKIAEEVDKEREAGSQKAASGTKRAYRKPEVKKYPLVQQTTGYIIYYYVT